MFLLMFCESKKKSMIRLRPQQIVDTVTNGGEFDYVFYPVDSFNFFKENNWKPYKATLIVYGSEVNVDSFIRGGESDNSFRKNKLGSEEMVLESDTGKFVFKDSLSFMKYKMFKIEGAMYFRNTVTKRDSVFKIKSFAVKKE